MSILDAVSIVSSWLRSDLKLDNILLTMDGHIKVADYGLCKESMTYGATTNTFCGTPEFMAPEILLEQEYGRAVDWWALGVLIYEMLLGQSPFKGQDEDEIFEAIIEDEVLYPTNMSREGVSILQMLLMKDPNKRLGASANDAEDIKAHSYFRGVSWDDIVNKRIPPPFVPQITHSKDVSNFDEEFTRELPVLTPIQNELSAEDQEEFTNFTYVAEWLSEYHQKPPSNDQPGAPPIPAKTIASKKSQGSLNQLAPAPGEQGPNGDKLEMDKVAAKIQTDLIIPERTSSRQAGLVDGGEM